MPCSISGLTNTRTHNSHSCFNIITFLSSAKPRIWISSSLFSKDPRPEETARSVESSPSKRSRTTYNKEKCLQALDFGKIQNTRIKMFITVCWIGRLMSVATVMGKKIKKK